MGVLLTAPIGFIASVMAPLLQMRGHPPNTAVFEHRAVLL